jgi:hypothetical protein
VTIPVFIVNRLCVDLDFFKGDREDDDSGRLGVIESMVLLLEAGGLRSGTIEIIWKVIFWKPGMGGGVVTREWGKKVVSPGLFVSINAHGRSVWRVRRALVAACGRGRLSGRLSARWGAGHVTTHRHKFRRSCCGAGDHDAGGLPSREIGQILVESLHSCSQILGGN